jgi:hypothetical protein
VSLFEEESRRERGYDRFDAFVGPFSLAGLALVGRWLFYPWVPLFGSDELDALFPLGLSGYLVSDGRWWLTAAVMTFSGMSGLLLHWARTEWDHFQKWTGSVAEGLAGFFVFGAAAIFGLLHYF